LKPIWGANKMLLEIKDLVVSYDGAQAVKGVTINVEEGSITTLIGANGAGKSSVLRAVSGLKKIDSGEIWFRGKRIDGIKPHKIVESGIGHVPEGRRVFGLMTVMHNLKVGAYLVKDKNKIEQNLKKVFHHFPRLEERSNQLAKTLSGGEQQMVAMGRALMGNPKILLLDEPSLGLAPLMVNEIGKIITDIRNEGLSVVLVEQNASMALKLADTACVLETGNLVLEGDAKKLASDDYIRKAYLGG
jgi:branched-chain amino acid transport system ATP-binding protein